MKSSLKAIWSFLADFGGVVSTVLLFIAVFKLIILKIKILFNSNILLGVGLLLIFVCSLIFIIFLFKQKIKKLSALVRTRVISQKLSPVIQNNDFDIKKALLSKNFFVQALLVSNEEAQKWAKDATVSSFNFYIDKEGNETSFTVQIQYFSLWKNEQFTVYHPNLSGNYERLSSHSRTEELIHYFFKLKNWQKAITVAYNKISSKLTDFRVAIQDSNRGTSITFLYQVGKIQERTRFVFDGKNLICEDKTSIKIN